MNSDGLETFFTANEQIELFLGSVLLGTALGAVFDVFRVIRIIFPAAGKRTAVTVCDILYMLIFGAAVFFYSAVFGRAEVRFFYAVGALLGAVLFSLTVGQAVISAVRGCRDLLQRLVRKIYNDVFAPIGKFFCRKYIKNADNFVHDNKISLENDEKS